MTLFDKSRRGRERLGAEDLALRTALKNWKKASEEARPKCARAILSNVGAMGIKLAECVEDPEIAQAIRDDAKREPE